MHHKAKWDCSLREPNFPALWKISWHWVTLVFFNIFLCPLQNGHTDAQKSHMDVYYEWRASPCCSLSQEGGPSHCHEIGICEDFRAGCRGTDLDTSPSFPFSLLSPWLSPSSTDQSGLGWTTVCALSFQNPFGQVLQQHYYRSAAGRDDPSDYPGIWPTSHFILYLFIHQYLFPKENVKGLIKMHDLQQDKIN